MKRFILAFTALVGIGGALAVADYTATQGAGTTFGSVIGAGTIHYAKWVLCDLTTPGTQCATVSATGQVATNTSQVNGVTPLMGNGATGTGSQRVTISSDNTFPTGWGASTIASGAVASGAYASGSIASGAVVDLGVQADTACATDNGTCTLLALVKRTNQRLTSAIAGTTAAITTWAGGTLGAMANYGTSPGAVLVPGVNAFVTNSNSNGIKTPTLSSPVVQAGMQYETVAASQTGQSLGATGGTGDFLSHCIVYPTTTTPGVVTVFDNTSSAAANVIAFPGGASSVSNLVPFAIPVGAFSTAGAWKVTTGANLVVTCVGNFT